MNTLERALLNLRNDPDVSNRAKQKIEQDAQSASEVCTAHLAYLMGRTDAFKDACKITKVA